MFTFYRYARVIVGTAFCLTSLIFPTTIYSAGLDNWYIRQTAYYLQDVVYDNNRYVAVGLGKTIISSTDGVNWQPASMKYGIDSYFGVAYGNNRFVAVGSRAVGSSGVEGEIASSSDGINWTVETSNSNNRLRAIVYDGSIFVTVGDSGTILSSTDASQWTLRNSNTTTHLYSVAYGNNTFVAVGNSGTILTSADGITWSSITPLNSYPLHAVEYLNGSFVAVGDGGQILTSGNGTDWTAQTSNTPYALYTVTYGDLKYVAAGQLGTVVTSANGSQWSVPYQQDKVEFSSIIYANNAFMGVGSRGAILTSSDAATWSYIFPDDYYLADSVYVIRYINNRFYAGGGRYTFMHSDDGKLWTLLSTGVVNDYRVRGIAYGNNTYVAVAGYTFSADARTLTSSDGLNWTGHSPGISDSLLGVAFANGTFVAVGYNNAYTSSNGINWNSPTNLQISYPSAIDYGNNIFVAVGYSGEISTSPDGDQWTLRNSGTTYSLNDIRFINGQFIIAGSHGVVLSSVNGIDWTPVDTGTTVDFYSVSESANYYVLGSANGIIYSTNGAVFAPRDTHTGITVSGLAFGNDTLVAGGDESTILQSDTIVAANEPDIFVSPSNVDFGAVTIGSSSAAQTITVSNLGTQYLTIGSASITGTQATDFQLQNDFCSSASVAPGNDCVLDVVFNPSADGIRSGTLNLPSNDPDRPNATVTLQGTGSAVPQPNISVTDSVAPANDYQIPFGTIDSGSSNQQTVNISNTGAAQLNVSSIQLGAANADQFSLSVSDGVIGRCSSLSPVLSGSTSCTLAVIFSPTSQGDKNAVLSIISDDPDESTVDLTLTGTAKAISQKPGDGSSGGGCFIATAAYGSYLHEDVVVLREFRDQVLMQYSLGRRAVELYYAYSPPIADRIAQSPSLKLITRVLLTPLVYAVKYPLPAMVILFTGLYLIASRIRKRFLRGTSKRMPA